MMVTVTIGDSISVPFSAFENCYHFHGETVLLLPLPRFYSGIENRVTCQLQY